jgi:hypothetical protein
MSYAAALVLAGVLLWAAAAKLSRPRTTAAAFAGLGVPGARVVPWVEVVVAVALVVRPSAGAPAAGGLLAAFTVVLVRAVRRGVEVGCACFGGTASLPVSSREVARNAGLLVLAGAAVGARASMPALAEVILVTTAAALGAVGLVALSVRREIGRLWDNRLAGEAAA